MSARIATTDTRLGHVEAAVDRLGDVRETVAEIRAEQRAQRTALDRIDRTVQRMAQPK